MSDAGAGTDKEDDFSTTNDGYRPPAQKTIDELLSADKEDESLARWKQSLIAPVSTPAAPDARVVVIKHMALAFDDAHPTVTLPLATEKDLKAAAAAPIVLKEGVEYRMTVAFQVMHQIVSGLKYMHVIKRKGIRVDKTEEMLGSYAPKESVLERTFAPEQVPSGMLARGTYHVKSKFVDDDGKTHLQWEWSFAIKKDWNSSGDDE